MPIDDPRAKAPVITPIPEADWNVGAFPIHRLHLEAGDILVVRLPRGTMGDVYRRIRESFGEDLKAAGHSNVPVIVCDEAMGLEVLRPEPGTSPYATLEEVERMVEDMIASKAARDAVMSGAIFGPIKWPDKVAADTIAPEFVERRRYDLETSDHIDEEVERIDAAEEAALDRASTEAARILYAESRRAFFWRRLGTYAVFAALVVFILATWWNT